jgi:hypothetical protein
MPPGPLSHELIYTLLPLPSCDTYMTAIPRKYITDARNQKQAVIVDLETFNRMESIIEDHGLGKYMEEAQGDETLSIHEAKKFYKSLKKG